VKAIFILSDSFRRDHVGAYGNSWIHTPNLDALAARSTVFDSAYAGSFPTGPNRRDMALGRGHAPGCAFNPWRNFGPDDVTMAARLSDAGVHTMMITDVANGATHERNMFRGFQRYLVNRGQEADGYWSDANVPLEFPVPHELIRYRAEAYHRVRLVQSQRRYEEDYFAPGTFRLACQWLERNRKRDDFLLWVETFDPHEPWDPPQWYVDRYDPGYAGRVLDCPPYGFYRRLGITPREMRHVQARYAAECTMVDAAVGRLLATLDRLGLTDEVAIVFTSDHGIYADYEGDAGCVCKPWVVNEDGRFMAAGSSELRNPTWLPLRTGTVRLPLIVKRPGRTRGRRVRAVAQPWDIHPTMLELFGAPVPDGLQGRSLLPLTEGGKLPPRPHAFNGRLFGGPPELAQAMNSRWIYSYFSGDRQRPSLLDLREDPSQTRNVAREHPQVCRRMHAALARFSPAQFEGVANPW